jgi:hypothetical protein
MSWSVIVEGIDEVFFEIIARSKAEFAQHTGPQSEM